MQDVFARVHERTDAMTGDPERSPPCPQGAGDPAPAAIPSPAHAGKYFRATGQPTARTIRVVYMKPSAHPGGGLDEVFRLHRAELVRVAAFILGDRAAAEDVVQDVFVRVHQRADPIDGDPQYYLRSAVINGCRTTLRRWRVVRRHAEQQGQQSSCPPLTTEEAALLDEESPAGPGGTGEPAPDVVAKCSCSASTWKCPRPKSAETLGISPGTVKSTAARGLAALARQLREAP